MCRCIIADTYHENEIQRYLFRMENSMKKSIMFGLIFTMIICTLWTPAVIAENPTTYFYEETNQTINYNWNRELNPAVPENGKVTVEFYATVPSGEKTVVLRFKEGNNWTAYDTVDALKIPMSGNELTHYSVDVDLGTGVAKVYKAGNVVASYTRANVHNNGTTLIKSAAYFMLYYGADDVRVERVKVYEKLTSITEPTRVTEVKYSSDGSNWVGTVGELSGITKAVSFKFNNAIANKDAVTAVITPDVADITKSYAADTKILTLTSAAGFAAGTDYKIVLSGNDANGELIEGKTVTFTTAAAAEPVVPDNKYLSSPTEFTLINPPGYKDFDLTQSIPQGGRVIVEFDAKTDNSEQPVQLRFNDGSKWTNNDVLLIPIANGEFKHYKVDIDLGTGIATAYREGETEPIGSYTGVNTNGISIATKCRIQYYISAATLTMKNLTMKRGPLAYLGVGFTDSYGESFSEYNDMKGYINSIDVSFSNDIDSNNVAFELYNITKGEAVGCSYSVKGNIVSVYPSGGFFESNTKYSLKLVRIADIYEGVLEDTDITEITTGRGICTVQSSEFTINDTPVTFDDIDPGDTVTFSFTYCKSEPAVSPDAIIAVILRKNGVITGFGQKVVNMSTLGINELSYDFAVSSGAEFDSIYGYVWDKDTRVPLLDFICME